MKHLAIATPFAVGGKQSQTVFTHDVGMLASRAFKDVAIDSFSAMWIEEPHEIQSGIFTRTHRAGLSNILPGAVFDSRNIT